MLGRETVLDSFVLVRLTVGVAALGASDRTCRDSLGALCIKLCIPLGCLVLR